MSFYNRDWLPWLKRCQGKKNNALNPLMNSQYSHPHLADAFRKNLDHQKRLKQLKKSLLIVMVFVVGLGVGASL